MLMNMFCIDLGIFLSNLSRPTKYKVTLNMYSQKIVKQHQIKMSVQLYLKELIIPLLLVAEAYCVCNNIIHRIGTVNVTTAAF